MALEGESVWRPSAGGRWTVRLTVVLGFVFLVGASCALAEQEAAERVGIEPPLLEDGALRAVGIPQIL